MERVAFLVEPGGPRIGCLLNPESVTIRRRSGVRDRSNAGSFTGGGVSDDPLRFTGGGVTEIDLDLLFDLSLLPRPTSPGAQTCEDVRDMTAPLWRLAENADADGAYGRPPVVRFVWGIGWNIPAVVTAVAERFEDFSPGGLPRRSWLRLRLRRVPEPVDRPLAPRLSTPNLGLPDVLEPGTLDPLPAGGIREVLGDWPLPGELGPASEGVSDRLDAIAHGWSGDPAHWRLLAMFNNIDDPLAIVPGTMLRLPPLSIFGAGGHAGGGTA